MIKTENVQIGGKMFIHTYSDKGCKIERDGELYDDAFDLEELGREYTETDELVQYYIFVPVEEGYQTIQ